MALSLLLSALLAAPAAAAEPPSLLLVGWDGSDRRVVRRLLDAGRLPNLSRLASRGSFVEVDVVSGGTETKPGWAEILTGRGADGMGIESNKIYRPVPPGLTVLEAWKAARPGACAFVVAGKDANVGARGPHEICLNCQSRDPSRGNAQTFWWDRARNFGRTQPGIAERWVKREGETLLHASKAVDSYENRAGGAAAVGPKALAALAACGERPFLGFVHFEDVDETGHRRFEPEPYEQALESLDAWLERLVAAAEKRGAAVLVATDHGFDVGTRQHTASPLAFAASSLKGLRPKGDRRDVGATLFRALGLPEAGLEGRPLQDAAPSPSSAR